MGLAPGDEGCVVCLAHTSTLETQGSIQAIDARCNTACMTISMQTIQPLEWYEDTD